MRLSNYVFMTCYLIAVFLLLDSDAALAADSKTRLNLYNIVWNSPSKNATGVMPLGNGDIAAGVYAIENGDLFLLLSKNDTYTYMGDIFKTGRVRVSLNPSPFIAGKPFRQTLDLTTGSIRIEADGIKLRIWADANRPVFHIEINSPKKVAVTVQPDLWKRIDYNVFNVTKQYTPAKGSWDSTTESTQDVRLKGTAKYYGIIL